MVIVVEIYAGCSAGESHNLKALVPIGVDKDVLLQLEALSRYWLHFKRLQLHRKLLN